MLDVVLLRARSYYRDILIEALRAEFETAGVPVDMITDTWKDGAGHAERTGNQLLVVHLGDSGSEVTLTLGHVRRDDLDRPDIVAERETTRTRPERYDENAESTMGRGAFVLDADLLAVRIARWVAGTGPGRPAVGKAIQIRLPADMIADVDATAQAEGVTRSQWIRQAVAARLAAARA